MDPKPKLLDIFVDGKKTGEVFDITPVVIDTDEECIKYLNLITKDLKLSEEEQALIDKCLIAANSKLDDDIEFGPSQMVGLSDLAISHPNMTNEILACLHHLTNSIGYDSEENVDPDFAKKLFSEMANIHMFLGDVHREMAKLSLQSFINEEITTDEEITDEEITDEEITDEEITDEETTDKGEKEKN